MDDLKLEIEKAELTDEVKRLGGDLESLVERVPSAYLNPRGDEWRMEKLCYSPRPLHGSFFNLSHKYLPSTIYYSEKENNGEQARVYCLPWTGSHETKWLPQ